MRTQATRLGALALLLAMGCFGEAPTIDGQTTGEPCPTGSQGCTCYPNGTCDTDLECGAGESLCVPQGCTPGEHACVCMDGRCASPWVCEGGLCADPGPGSSGGSTDASTSNGASTSSDVDSTSSTTSGEDDSTGPSDESTTGETNACAGETNCSDCLVCASQGGPCASAHAECMSIGSSCTEMAACQASCAFYFDCGSSCCDAGGDTAAIAADALTACRVEVCGVPCRAGTYPMCAG